MKESSLRNLIETKKSEQVVILSAPWCTKCKNLKRLMDSNKISYYEIDLSQYSDEDLESIGAVSIPIVYYKDTLLVDPPFAAVKQLITQ